MTVQLAGAALVVLLLAWLGCVGSFVLALWLEWRRW